MGAVDTLKETIGLIQKIDNLELYRQMIDLQTQVFDLVEENRSLKERLSTRETLTFRANAYWAGEDGPFCSSCWDSKFQLVRLHSQKGFYPSCPVCKSRAVSPDAEPAAPIPRRTSRSGYLDR